MFTLESPAACVVAACMSLAAGTIAAWRAASLPRLALILGGTGLLLICLAAGGLAWRASRSAKIVVMVDLSASTRTADFRDRAHLDRRIAQLLGQTPHRIVYFAQQQQAGIAGQRLADLPGGRTVFEPPATHAIMLFSDGRFEPPAVSPPVYCVVDAGLRDARDASIADIELRDRSAAVALRAGTDARRQLSLTVDASVATTHAVSGASVIAIDLPDAAQRISASLDAHDPWPENDTMAIRIPAGDTARWWVGRRPPPTGFASVEPSRLPLDAADYLAPSAIVLDNIAASELSAAQRQRLLQYARDLGGAMVILGGEEAFAAGAYQGTPLEDLSPLASHPPAPTTHWILLLDASGSMAAGAPGPSRWELQTRAVLRLLPGLPPNDPLSMGSFAQELRWWSVGKSARETAALRLPPVDVAPSGPTNLEPALRKIIASADGALPAQLLVLTDAETQIADANALRRGFSERRIRLHVLALSPGRAVDILADLAKATDGQFMRSFEPVQWAAAAQKLGQAAQEPPLLKGPLRGSFVGRLAPLAKIDLPLANRTWLKKGATLLCESDTAPDAPPLAAQWNFGEGAVLAAAFAPSPELARRMVAGVSRAPRDPRFTIAWRTGGSLHVRIDAADGDRMLNGLSLSLQMSADGGGDQSRPIAQTAPGRYELTLPSPREPMLATVRHEGRALDRRALPGRYAQEFDAIGLDLDGLRSLASRTGGRVIGADETRPIEFRVPTGWSSLAAYAAAAGGVLIAAALVRWRLS